MSVISSHLKRFKPQALMTEIPKQQINSSKTIFKRAAKQQILLPKIEPFTYDSKQKLADFRTYWRLKILKVMVILPNIIED